METTQFPVDSVAIKIAVSMGIGLLVGLEREWSQKDLGVRTFSITCLTGALSALVSREMEVGRLLGILTLVILTNVRALIHTKQLETTTSSVLLGTFVFGVLVGEGHLFTPVAAAIVVTLLLSAKQELRRFAGGLKPAEVRSAVLLGLIAFVIFPILPDQFIDRWRMVNPREVWITVVAIAAIGFVNYILLRVFSTKGLVYTAILGGLVNSTATIAELSAWLKEPPFQSQGSAYLFCFLTVIAMLLRNLVLLALFAEKALRFAVGPILAMTVCAAVFAFWRNPIPSVSPDLKLSSPISLRRVFSFGLLFVAIQMGSTVGRRLLGQSGVLLISFMGGLASSASTTAAAANLSARAEITPSIAALATVLTSISSALVNLPVIQKITGRQEMVRGLLIRSAIMVAVGIAVWGTQAWVGY